MGVAKPKPTNREDPGMNLHANARTTPLSRKLLIDRVLREGWRVTEAAEAAGVSRTTAYKWLARYGSEGAQGLQDRSSAPHRIPRRTARKQVLRIKRLRRRWLTGSAIAGRLRMALSTVGGILRRLGLGSLKALRPKEPVVRYERDRPGELLHLDVKKLGRFRRAGHRVTGDRKRASRGSGWEYVHVCVDDHSRVAYAEILPDERKESCALFLARAARWFEERGVRVEEVMTDNAKAYGSGLFQDGLKALGAKHIRTRPYRPQTNGKAERFIQTLIREWAYARTYRTASARATALGPWLDHYNRERPHGGIGGAVPFARLPGRP